MAIELQHDKHYIVDGLIFKAHYEEGAGWWELGGVNIPTAYIVTPSGRLYAGFTPTEYTLDDVHELPDLAETPAGDWWEIHGPSEA